MIVRFLIIFGDIPNFQTHIVIDSCSFLVFFMDRLTIHISKTFLIFSVRCEFLRKVKVLFRLDKTQIRNTLPGPLKSPASPVSHPRSYGIGSSHTVMTTS